MSGNTYGEIEYIKKMYIKQGVLNNDGSKKIGIVDYNIYPWEKGFIPKCQICKEVYDKFTEDINVTEIYSPHCMCSCLWWDWYKDKILQLNKNISIKNKYK